MISQYSNPPAKKRHPMAKFITLNHQIINLDHIIKIEMTKMQECSVKESLGIETMSNGTTAYMRSPNAHERSRIHFTDTGFLIKVYLTGGHHMSFNPIKQPSKAEAFYHEIQQLLGAEKIINPID